MVVFLVSQWAATDPDLLRISLEFNSWIAEKKGFLNVDYLQSLRMYYSCCVVHKLFYIILFVYLDHVNHFRVKKNEQ